LIKSRCKISRVAEEEPIMQSQDLRESVCRFWREKKNSGCDEEREREMQM
jgi:hypothetical protein